MSQSTDTANDVRSQPECVTLTVYSYIDAGVYRVDFDLDLGDHDPRKASAFLEQSRRYADVLAFRAAKVDLARLSTEENSETLWHRSTAANFERFDEVRDGEWTVEIHQGPPTELPVGQRVSFRSDRPVPNGFSAGQKKFICHNATLMNEGFYDVHLANLNDIPKSQQYQLTAFQDEQLAIVGTAEGIKVYDVAEGLV